MINELKKSFTSILFKYGKGSLDPAAILSKYLLHQKGLMLVSSPITYMSPPRKGLGLLSHAATTLSSPSTCASPGTCATPNRKGLTLLFDAAAVVTPTAVNAKRSTLTSLGVDVENGNRLTLLAASREFLEFLMDGK
jgi:hypothetical protein